MAVTAAVVTLAVAGLIFELRGYAEDSALAQARPERTVQTPCPAGVDDPVQCAVPAAEH
jgi:hypothetical protein